VPDEGAGSVLVVPFARLHRGEPFCWPPLCSYPRGMAKDDGTTSLLQLNRRGASHMRSHASISLTSSLPPLSLLEEVLYDLPPLEGVLLHWHMHGAAALTPGIVSLFSRRRYLLGPTTLPGTSIQLLATCVEEYLTNRTEEAEISPWEARPLHTRLVRHSPSYSAMETQALLPPGVLVQKTVTLAVDELLVLCTGVGTWQLSRQDLHAITRALGLSSRRSRHTTINPASFQTVEEFGMLPGMVSPFLRPMRATRLAALVVLPWPRCWETQRREVAISLSLWESLILPLSCLRSLLRSYSARTYPEVRLIDLQETGEDNEPPGDADASSRVVLTASAAHVLVGIDQGGGRR